MMISADRDPLALQPFHHDLLFEKLLKEGAADITEMKIDTDHSFSDRRIALCRSILDWIGERF